MASHAKKIVLLACGSFNPVTFMHLRMFELARNALEFSNRFKVSGGILSPVNDGYKKEGLINSEYRLTMCHQACSSSSWISVDEWESKQSCWQPTLDVLNHIKKSLEDNTLKNLTETKFTGNATPMLLCGADVVASFAVPNLWKTEDLLSIVRDFGIVVITRTGTDIEKFIYESEVLSEHRNNIHIIKEWSTNDISATKIRRSIRRGESIKYLIPDSVIDYIEKNNLYKT